MRKATWADIRPGAVIRSAQGYVYRIREVNQAKPHPADMIESMDHARATSPGCIGGFYIWREGVDDGRYTLVEETPDAKP